MLPERFIASVKEHIITSYGECEFGELFYGQTKSPHAKLAGHGSVHWQVAVLRSRAISGKQSLHFYSGETDPHSGAFGSSVEITQSCEPIQVRGMYANHLAIVALDGGVQVSIGHENIDAQ